MIAGPSRALLEQALQLRDSGVTLATTAKFRDLLGPDGQVNVSALVYTNIAPIAQSASEVLAQRRRQGRPPERARPQLGKMLAGQGPTLYYAYAEPDRIVFAGSNQNPLGLNLGTLASFGGMLGGMHQAERGRRPARGGTLTRPWRKRPCRIAIQSSSSRAWRSSSGGVRSSRD